MSNLPSPTEDYGVEEASPTGGRDSRGRFTAGNAFSRGNPHAQRVGQLRSMLLQGVTDDDWQAILRRMIQDARDGDRAARAELLDRLFGRARVDVCIEPAEAEQIRQFSEEEAREARRIAAVLAEREASDAQSGEPPARIALAESQQTPP